MKDFSEAKIAIVADWLTDPGGAEKVVYAFHRMFPDAPIFTSIFDADRMKAFEGADVRTSFLQNWPMSKRKHQLYLRWMPTAFEQFDLSEYDIVLSSAHSCAKGVITRPQTMHVCYCHSPMRYVWDDCHRYINDYPWPKIVKMAAPYLLHNIRMWDRLAADRVDYFISNSDFIGERIKKYYKAESETVYPIVETEDFYLSAETESFYLAVGRLIPYKRFDLIVEAFNHLGKPLKIVGRGPEAKKLKRIAGKNIEFLDFVSDEKLRELLSTCKGFVFPQLEDFGIAPVEAMASGRPVIAYNQGGALETVKDGVSGMFFKEQTVESLVRAVLAFEKKNFDSKKVAESVADFGRVRFEKEMKGFLEKKWKEFNRRMT